MEPRGQEARHKKDSWDDLWRSRKRLYVYRNVLHTAEQYLGGLAGKDVLEVGCGRGATLLEFACRGANVVGLDYSAEALSVCRALESQCDLKGHATFVNGDAAQLPFPAESFDLVFSVGLIEHFRDPLRLIAEQKRVARKGGFVLVQVPQKYSVYTLVKQTMIGLRKWRYGGWETQYSDREISALVAESGLQVEDVYGYGSFLLAAMRHAFMPTLDFGMFWRNGTELPSIRAIKSKAALELCALGSKPVSTPDQPTETDR